MIRTRRIAFALMAGAVTVPVSAQVTGTSVPAGSVQPASAPPAPTPTASLADLLAEADAANPRIVAARSAAEAAAARVPQAGALPDPTVGIGFMNVPVTSPGLNGDMMTMTQLQVGARLPWRGKLGLREEVARLQAEAADQEVERVRDQVAADIQSLYARIYFIDRAVGVTARNETVVRDFALLTSAKYGVGTGAQADVLRAQVERTRLTDQLVGLGAERRAALARLNALVGRPSSVPLPAAELPASILAAALAEGAGRTRFASAALADVLPGGGEDDGVLRSVSALQALAREHSPALRAAELRVAAQERSVALARKAELPDVNVSAGYSRRAGRGDFFNLMVSAPVPIFSGRKQDQGVLEEAATAAERGADLRGVRDELDAEISARHAELRRARDQLVLLEDGILPQARTGLSSATASYQVGRVDFLTLLDAQVTLYRHELDYHRLLSDFATNLAALERAVGTEILK